MAEKMISREITSTLVKSAKMEVVEGTPVATPVEDVTLVGNVSLEKAQKELRKIHGDGVTVFQVIPNTKQYQIPVSLFLQHATVKEVTAE